MVRKDSSLDVLCASVARGNSSLGMPAPLSITVTTFNAALNKLDLHPRRASIQRVSQRVL